MAEVRFESNRAAVELRIAGEARIRMEQATELVRGEALRLMSGPKHGRRYRVPGTQVFYTASAPGEAPAVPTGRLRGSVNREVRVSANETIGVVGTELGYGRDLEFGKPPRLRPRPWLRPAFDAMRGRIAAKLEEKWF